MSHFSIHPTVLQAISGGTKCLFSNYVRIIERALQCLSSNNIFTALFGDTAVGARAGSLRTSGFIMLTQIRTNSRNKSLQMQQHSYCSRNQRSSCFQMFM